MAIAHHLLCVIEIQLFNIMPSVYITIYFQVPLLVTDLHILTKLRLQKCDILLTVII